MMQHFTTKNTSGKTNTKQYIVLHHTATAEGTAQGVINGFVNGDRASCHYIVDEKGQVYSFNTENDILRHAGESIWKGNHNMNKYSIGIEVIGPLSGKDKFTDAQRKSVAYLIKDIATRNNIKTENILRHKDVSPGRKVDIYDDFWSNTHKTRNEYVHSIFGDGETDILKKKQADAVVKEVSNLRSMTKLDENRQKLHDFNEWIRETYK